MSVLSKIRQRLRESRGFTLVEIIVAMGIGSLVMGGVFLIYNQLFSVTATNSNYMAAFRQVQNAGDWITNDVLTAQEVYEMTDTTLDADIDKDDTEIAVADTTDWEEFPGAGIICIGNEIIQYTGIDTDTDEFTGCIRGSEAEDHDEDDAVTFFVSVGRADWDGNLHQMVYNLTEDEDLIRTHLMMATGTTDWVVQSSSRVAEKMVILVTTSTWNQSRLELEVELTANFGGFILGRHGLQSFEATRIYKIHPRPFI
jgi:prepilin-type N-terminal cleavage/methylation domain-containing protein